MIDFGFASSHGPNMYYSDPEAWEHIYKSFLPNNTMPLEVEDETPEVIRGFVERIDRGWAILKTELENYAPDILVIVGGDQQEMFDERNRPQILLYAGEDASGSWAQTHYFGEQPSEENTIEFKLALDTTERLLHYLVRQEGFDVAVSREQKPVGRYSMNGQAHPFVVPIPRIMPKRDIPVILLYVNTFDIPCINSEVCYELGLAIARFFETDKRHIAIYGSGGLSHELSGARTCWIDTKLDEWILEQIATGNGQALKGMFTFDSDTMLSGTGEVRSWIVATAAMEASGRRAKIIDYIPSFKSATGMAYAYWPENQKDLDC